MTAPLRLPVALDDELVARAQEVGLTTEYHRMPGGTHGYQGSGFFEVPVDGEQTPYDRLLDFAEASLGSADA